MPHFTLEELDEIISRRVESTAERSYTKSLLDGGPDRAARKFGEEALELVIAALTGETTDMVAEAADVLFHFLVLLRTRGVDYAQVTAELERRTGASGHAEKAARTAP